MFVRKNEQTGTAATDRSFDGVADSRPTARNFNKARVLHTLMVMNAGARLRELYPVDRSAGSRNLGECLFDHPCTHARRGESWLDRRPLASVDRSTIADLDRFAGNKMN